MTQLNAARQELAELRRERDTSVKPSDADGAPTIAAINADLRDLRSAAERARSTVSFSVQRESADCEALRAENARLTALNATLTAQFDTVCEESDELRRQLETARSQYAETRASSSQHEAHLREMAAHVRAIALAQSEIGALMAARFSSSIADRDASSAAAPAAGLESAASMADP
jgi:chromosome segregation ATPase